MSSSSAPESGLTLVELLVALSLFLVALLLFGGALISTQKMQATSGEYSRSNDQVHLALQAIDRQIRSGYVAGISAGSVPDREWDSALTIFTEAGGVPRCVRWAVADSDATQASGVARLYSSEWFPASLVPAQRTPPSFSALSPSPSWILVADNLWNWLAPTKVAPFSPDPSAAEPLSTVDVKFVLNSSTRDAAVVEVGSAYTSRNVARSVEDVLGIVVLPGQPTPKKAVVC